MQASHSCHDISLFESRHVCVDEFSDWYRSGDTSAVHVDTNGIGIDWSDLVVLQRSHIGCGIATYVQCHYR